MKAMKINKFCQRRITKTPMGVLLCLCCPFFSSYFCNGQ